MTKKFLLFLFYISFAIVYTFGFLHNFIYCKFPDNTIREAIREKVNYLTVWNYGLGVIYFLLCTINALQNIYSKSIDSVLNKLCNRFFISLVFPVGMVVVITFWLLYAIDRELVFSKIYDDVIPSWQNHIMHTLPLFTCILDNYLIYHTYPSFFYGASITAIFGLTYIGYVFLVAYLSGIWIYPVLRVLNAFYRSIFIASISLFLIVFYKIGEFVNSILWSNELKKQKIRKMK